MYMRIKDKPMVPFKMRWYLHNALKEIREGPVYLKSGERFNFINALNILADYSDSLPISDEDKKVLFQDLHKYVC